MKVEVGSRNVTMAPRWKDEIDKRMTSLQAGHQDLTHGRVTLMKNRHHKKDVRVAEALIVVALPGRHTITARKKDKTFEEAIRSAFFAVETELCKYREKRVAKKVRMEPEDKGEQATIAGPIVSLIPALPGKE